LVFPIINPILYRDLDILVLNVQPNLKISTYKSEKCNLIAFRFCLSLHLMKIAVRILTIYMFALSLAPCGDGGNGVVEIAKHFFGVEHQHISDHDQHSNGCGDDIRCSNQTIFFG